MDPGSHSELMRMEPGLSDTGKRYLQAVVGEKENNSQVVPELSGGELDP